MKKYSLLLLTIATLTVVLQGCLNDKGIVPKPPEPLCDSLNVSYNLDVKPIVAASCATSVGCHAPGSYQGDFTSYANLSGVSQTVKTRIKLDVSDPLHMPQGAALSQEELAIFLCWIEAGALNN